MNWTSSLTNEADLAKILQASYETPQVIFKHSTRCSISSMAKNRLERSDNPESIQFNLLDLITYRDMSKTVAENFKVSHESPQVLLIKNGECIYDESHNGIRMEEILEEAKR